MLDRNTVAVQAERYRNLLCEAETERLLKQARTTRNEGGALRRQALGWLGSRLVAWGQRLQGGARAPSHVANLAAETILSTMSTSGLNDLDRFGNP
jgi:hypothetical protein